MATTTVTSSTTISPLLTLPLELRLQIYAYLLPPLLTITPCNPTISAATLCSTSTNTTTTTNQTTKSYILPPFLAISPSTTTTPAATTLPTPCLAAISLAHHPSPPTTTFIPRDPCLPLRLTCHQINTELTAWHHDSDVAHGLRVEFCSGLCALGFFGGVKMQTQMQMQKRTQTQTQMQGSGSGAKVQAKARKSKRWVGRVREVGVGINSFGEGDGEGEVVMGALMGVVRELEGRLVGLLEGQGEGGEEGRKKGVRCELVLEETGHTCSSKGGRRMVTILVVRTAEEAHRNDNHESKGKVVPMGCWEPVGTTTEFLSGARNVCVGA